MDESATHRCTRCKKDLPPTAFSPSQRLLAGAWCKACAAEQRREKRAGLRPRRVADTCVGPGCSNDIQHLRAHAKYCSNACASAAWRENNPGGMRRLRIRFAYGMEVEEVDALFASQGGRCAVCDTDEPSHALGWQVDHCHDTGRVRGILCASCNTGMGQLGDDPERLRRAIAYLERS